ncbi:DUF1641 domain-containing protein [Mycobacterium sp. Y57]|uniref:DUF1641 domain-containing protein n=1 Tax=Mycolicibacterium xanthum TaxID=2796469 RepID=UPI001C847AA4|nr:DUF1641 domain-containing protein [Mycolicibacterium xanthum]MBX7430921.1 DUF1641 domain-containing protein [Mycolicibacterium xanthum]
MGANGQATTPVLEPSGPADAVRARLDDPRVAEALDTLLDHADLLAVLVSGLDGFVRRGDDITANLNMALGELGAQSGQVPALASLKQVDLGQLSTSLAVLTGGLVKATPAINTLLNSALTDQQSAEVVSALGEALVSARASVPAPPTGMRGLWKTLRAASKDPDVTRGLAYLIEVARQFGKKV